MGVYEEAKIRLQDLQKRVKRVDEAGQALTDDKTNKTAKSKFKVMYAVLENLRDDFEMQLGIVIKQKSKGSSTDPAFVDIDTDNLRADFEEAYFRCKIVADEFLLETSNPDLNQTFISPSPRPNCASAVPLEKLTIAKFKGDPKEYTGFRNLFDTIVHANTTIRPVVKFGYLKSYLEGEPLKLIANLMLTDSNYELALLQLDSRYSNRRLIAESHLDELFDAPKLSGGIKNLTISSGSMGPSVTHKLQKKLDTQLRAQWELAVDTTIDPTITEFTTFLTKFSKSATASQGKGVNEKPISKLSKSYRTTTLYSVQPNITTSKNGTTSPSLLPEKIEKKSFVCQVCGAQPGHLLIYCPLFKEKTPKQRHQIIKELKRCFVCFSEHMVNKCTNRKVH